MSRRTAFSVVLLVCVAGVLAEPSAPQQAGRTRPITTADSTGGFALRRLDGPVKADGKTWVDANAHMNPGTYEAPDHSFRLILGDPSEAGDVVRYRATIRTAAEGLPAVIPEAVSYALVMPGSRWVVYEPLELLDVHAWRLYPLSKAFGLKPYVVPRFASPDGSRLVFSMRACAVDCPDVPAQYFELTFPTVVPRG